MIKLGLMGNKKQTKKREGKIFLCFIYRFDISIIVSCCISVCARHRCRKSCANRRSFSVKNMAFSRRFVAPLANDNHLWSIQAGIVKRFLNKSKKELLMFFFHPKIYTGVIF
jgi:hypothetical protein